MIKTSASDGDRDKTFHYNQSRVGYVTSNDDVALSNYLVKIPSHTDVILDIDVEEELNDRVNGEDSDDDGDDAIDLENTMREVELDRSFVFFRI